MRSRRLEGQRDLCSGIARALNPTRHRRTFGALRFQTRCNCTMYYYSIGKQVAVATADRTVQRVGTRMRRVERR